MMSLYHGNNKWARTRCQQQQCSPRVDSHGRESKNVFAERVFRGSMATRAHGEAVQCGGKGIQREPASREEREVCHRARGVKPSAREFRRRNRSKMKREKSIRGQCALKPSLRRCREGAGVGLLKGKRPASKERERCKTTSC